MTDDSLAKRVASMKGLAHPQPKLFPKDLLGGGELVSENTLIAADHVHVEQEPPYKALLEEVLSEVRALRRELTASQQRTDLHEFLARTEGATDILTCVQRNQVRDILLRSRIDPIVWEGFGR